MRVHVYKHSFDVTLSVFPSFCETRTVISNTNIKEKEKVSQIALGFDYFFIPDPEEKANESFVCLVDRSLDNLVEGTQVKTTKHATKCAVHVFPR